MTADPSPHEKALAEIISDLEWRIKKWMQQEVGQRPPFTDQDARIMSDALKAIRSPYLTARVPDDVGEVAAQLKVAAESCRTDSAFAAGNKAHKWAAELIDRAALILRAAALLTRQSERIRGLEAEGERLKALSEGRWKDAADLRIKSMGPAPDGKGFDVQLQSPTVALMAEHIASEFKRMGGKNFVQIEMSAEDTGPLVFTVQRKWGELPAAQAGRYRSALQTLLANSSLNPHQLDIVTNALKDPA